MTADKRASRSRGMLAARCFVIEDEKIVATEEFHFLLNRFVRFKVSDVAIPGPQEVVNELYGGDIVQGKVVDITKSGAQEQAFIVVKVEAMKDVSHSSRRKGDWNDGPVSELLHGEREGICT